MIAKRIGELWGRVELGAAGLALLLMAVLPVSELLLRACFSQGIPSSANYVQNLTLWVGFLGAMICSQRKKHLTLVTFVDRLPPAWQKAATLIAAIVSTAVATALSWASAEFVRSEMDAPTRVSGWLPVWVAELILPLSFAAMAVRFVLQAGGWPDRLIALLGVPIAW